VTDPAAVVFDLDGVLIDSETAWDEARRAVVEESGGTWRPEATRAMMGMSSVEWSAYLHDELGVPLAAQEISDRVVGKLERRYRERLPLIEGAAAAVERLGARWPLALASSANRPVIELVLAEARLTDRFRATVSAEEVAHGKPAPDVYLEAARRLAAEPRRCVAVEDSSNGLRSAAAAGMAVVAIPNRAYPPEPDALALAAATIASLHELTPALVGSL
jgi:HAD superfamily hydrolase (TIGR01509 family)